MQRRLQSTSPNTAGSELLVLASALSAAVYRRLKPEITRKEAQRFADEVMAAVAATYDTRLLGREFIHTHESAIVLFMTLSIVVFNFYPITALMIILLALLNDLPILAIAYDNTKVDLKPVRWNMPEMLTVSSVLGVAGAPASFLFFFCLRSTASLRTWFEPCRSSS